MLRFLRATRKRERKAEKKQRLRRAGEGPDSLREDPGKAGVPVALTPFLEKLGGAQGHAGDVASSSSRCGHTWTSLITCALQKLSPHLPSLHLSLILLMSHTGICSLFLHEKQALF